MKHYKPIILLLFTCIFGSLCRAGEPYSKWMADSEMARRGTITTWDYPAGLFMESLLKVHELYKEDKYYTYTLNHAKATVNSNGKIGSKFSFTAYNLDYVNPGMFLLKVHEREEAANYKVALDTLRKQLDHQPRNEHGGFWHKKVYPHQMWLDGLFMGARYYAAYEKKFNNGNKWSDVVDQFVLIHSKTYDADYQLNYHAWAAVPTEVNCNFWANQTAPFLGCSKEFWARGLGWYAAALVDVIEILPDTYERKAELKQIFAQVMAGVKRWQDNESGCWYQLLRYDNTFTSKQGNKNYLESSASSMFTYVLFKALRLGLVDEATYEQSAVKAYKGLIANFISESSGSISLNNICSSAGLGPSSSKSRDGSADYYLDGSDAGKKVSNDMKGVGPFIMASVEYEMYQERKATSIREIKEPNANDIRHEGNFLRSATNQTLKLYDLNGRFIATGKVIDTTGLPMGMYVVTTDKKSYKIAIGK
ncbi:glycoside hydrolase family 88 protein [Bacteroides sp. 214]|uniref:glycoside hydrolase family 88 protein n=1 Tax=Bacteroides sp. 214 TaxID=2302935 RepID=UPI0013D42C52|nr:glycoside hydrolase family 88 protein [Bacteroides sp. 214]